MSFAGVALALLVSAGFHHLHGVAVALAEIAVLLSGGRLAVTFGEVSALTKTKAEMRNQGLAHP